MSSIDFSFKLRGQRFKPDRLIHIYDISGEVFTDRSDEEMEKQYDHCNGIALIIDPFSIPNIRYEYENQLEEVDLKSIGSADINLILDTFIGKLKEISGLQDRDILKVPLAVIINKVDSANLMDKLRGEAVNDLIKTDPDKYSNEMDCEDYLCRKFLKDNGAESVLNLINIKFKNNRYFACSSIGHPKNQGKYEPQGVMPPMEWLLENADKTIASEWRDTIFTKKPLS